MSDWADARQWAEEQAQAWFETADPFEVGSVPIGWPLQISAFEAFLRVAASADGELSIRKGLSPIQLIKRQGLDRAVRSMAVRILARGSSRSQGTGAVLFLSEVPTPSMMEPSLLVANALDHGEVDVAVGDPRAFRIWRSHGYDPRPIVLPIREEVARVASGRRQANAVWRRYVATDPRFTFAGQDLTRASIRELRPIVVNSAPWLSVELEALRGIVSARKPTSIVVATDQHRLGRLASHVAEETGTPLVVLQHGLPQTPIAYLPVVADCVVVWSEDVRGWFVDNGTAPERIVVAGNPRLDRLVSLSGQSERSKISALEGLGGEPKLLVALSPLDVVTNLRVLEIGLAAIREHPSGSAVVKLHPGQGNNRPVIELVRKSGLGQRVQVLRNEAVLPLLLWADLTLLYRSSVALESLAAGTPVAVADVGGRSIAHDELRSLDLPLVRDEGEFLAAMVELTSERGSRDYFRKRAADLERQIGPLDGMSANRIADMLRVGLTRLGPVPSATSVEGGRG